MSDDKKGTDQTEDPELNDLLDSALEDFNTETKVSEKHEKHEAAAASAEDTVEPLAEDDTWTKEFIKQATDQFEKNLQNLMQNGTDVDLGTSFQKMAQTVASVMTEGEGLEADNANADFQTAIAQALKDLSATSENLQNDAELAAMFNQTSLEEGADFFPFMQGMMQSLLSKDILYPSFKDLIDRYIEWLQEKEATLAPTDLEKYKKQLELMQKVCNEFDKEKDDDTEEIKKRRFETILSLLQEMQSCGQPPEELIGEQPPFFQFDAQGHPIMPSSPSGAETPQNCSIM